MPDEVKRQILRLEVDQAAVKKAISDTDRLNKTVADLRKETLASSRQMGPAEASLVKYGKSAQVAGREVDTLRAKLDKTDRALKSNRKEFDANAQAAKEYEKQLRDIRERAGTFGDVETSSRAITGAIGAFGGGQFERTANLGNELLAATEGVKRLGAELPKLAKQLGLTELGTGKLALGIGVAAVAVTGVVLAIDALDGSSNRAREAVQAQIRFEQDLADLRLGKKTTAQLQEEADALKETIDARAEQIANLQLTKFEAKDSANAWDTFKRVFLGHKDAVSDTEDELTALVIAQEADLKVWREINDAINEGVPLVNDMAEAERALNDARYNTLLRGAQIQIQANQMSEEQLDNRLEQIALERDTYQRLYSSLEAISGTTIDYSAELELVSDILDKLTQEEQILNDVRSRIRPEVAGLAKLHEDSIGTYEAAKKAYADVVAEADKYAETVAKRQQQLLQTAQKRALQLAQDEEEASLDRSRKVADHYADLADIDRKFYEDRGEILKDAIADLDANQQERADELVSLNKDLERLAGEHSRNMRRIARDAQRDEIRAARNLDAVALADAKTARKDAIEDENDQYDDEKKAREDQFQERLDLLDRERRETLDNQQQALRDLEAQHRRERAENERAFAEELRREDEDRRIKLAHQQQQFALEDQQQRQQWALEDAQRRNAFVVQATQTKAHMDNINAITLNGLAQVERNFAGSFNKLVSTVSGIASAKTTGSRAVSSNRAVPYAYADGGYPPVGRDVLVGERGPEIARFMMPTRIYPAGVNPGSRGGSLSEGAIQININGSTSPQLTARAVRQQVEGILAEYWR